MTGSNFSGSLKQGIKMLYVLHLAIIAGLVVLTGLFVYLVRSTAYDTPENMTDIFNILVPIVIVSALAGSHLVFKSAMASVEEGMELEEKFSIYRQAAILRLALLEGSGLFATIGYFFTAQYLYLVATGVMVAIMVYYRPIPDLIASELNLNESERRELEE